MRSRNKIIILILSVWILLISFTLIASRSIFISGFERLEHNSAIENANRSYRISMAILNYIFLQNQDNATWDDAYLYIQNKNPDFIKDNYLGNFFSSNHFSYLIIINNAGKVVWADAYDLYKNTRVPVEPEVLEYFTKNALRMIKNPSNYSSLNTLPNGISGFYLLNSGIIAYFSLNGITNTQDNAPTLGVMIFGKKLTPHYLKNISDNLDYPMSFIPINQLKQYDNGQEILDALTDSKSVYVEVLNKNILISYKLLRDFDNKPVGVFRIQLSREIYNQSKHSAFEDQLILLAFSLLGALGMSLLVYLFFRKQELITNSFERFVPRELIDLLAKRDILDVNLGDNSKRLLSVMFLDIRNFTTISEKLTSQQNFDFVNGLLKRIAPIISYNSGFIDKYIGDAVMALFPLEKSNADDAAKAAVMISSELKKFNQENSSSIPVQLGIGINTGEAMLGIIGAKGRLEGTVISDMVNTASRIQELTKHYNQEILISEACYKAMKHPGLYKISHVDDVLVKGKTVAVSVYSIGIYCYHV